MDYSLPFTERITRANVSGRRFGGRMGHVSSTSSELRRVTRNFPRNRARPAAEEEFRIPGAFPENLEYYDIDGVEFGMYTKESLVELGAVEVIKEKTSQVTREEGGIALDDTRLGSLDPQGICIPHRTREGFVQRPPCVKPGMISLIRPVYHPALLRKICYILNSICKIHSDLIVSESLLIKNGLHSYSGTSRIKFIATQAEKVYAKEEAVVRCRSQEVPAGGFEEGEGVHVYKCGCVAIKVDTKESLKEREIYYYYGKSKKKKSKEREFISIEEVYRILKNIPRDAVKIMGFRGTQRPENAILRALYVIPPAFRRERYVDGRVKKHPFTRALAEIIKANNALKKSVTKDNVNKLKLEVSRLMVPEKEERKGRNQEPHAISSSISKKEGTIRKLALGKRQNYSGRTVITPATDLEFGQVGIPMAMRGSLEIPERVTQYNKRIIEKLLERGDVTRIINNPDTINSGSFRVAFDENGKPVSIPPLKIGSIVERKLTNGDIVLINRNPTLHRYGNMGQEVVLHKNISIRLHLSSTPCYNADFDGDEASVYLPRSVAMRAEARILASARENLMNSQSGAPVSAPVFDALTGSTKLTEDETILDPNTFNSCIMTVGLIPPDYDERIRNSGINPLSGKALFSVLLPQITYVRDGVTIIRGVLTRGSITSKHIGLNTGSLVKYIIDQYGGQRAVQFISDATFLINRYLQLDPITVGLGDCYLGNIDEDVGCEGPKHQTYAERIHELYKKTLLIISDINMSIQNPVEREKRENVIKGHIDSFSNQLQKIVKEYLSRNPENNFRLMMESGAKGSFVNLAQIAASLGQQLLYNARLVPPASSRPRCLHYFSPEENTLESRGFCISSFFRGLSPSEYFFHQISAREGLVDVATKTADASIIERLAGSALTNFTVTNDGSVRNVGNTIFQPLYGEDGFSGEYLYQTRTGDDIYGSFIDLTHEIQQLNADVGWEPGTY